MSGARKFWVGVLVTVLGLSSLGAAYSYVNLKTIHNKEVVKSWLNESGLYDSVVDAALSSAAKSEEGQGENVPTDDPGVSKAVKTVLTPAFIQKNVDLVLDGTYSWLDGKTASPVFVIDLAAQKQQLADAIGGYATSKAAALPTCTPEQITPDFDALTSACIPPGVTPEQAGQSVSDSLLNSGDFLKKTQINGSDIKVGDSGVAVGESKQGKLAQKTYQYSAFLPMVLGVIALLSALGIVLLSKPRAHGMRRVGVTWLVVGILLGLNYLAFFFAGSRVEHYARNSANTPAVQTIIANFVRAVLPDLRRNLLLFVVGFLAASVLLIVVGSLMKNGRKKVEDVETEEKEAQEETETKAEIAAAKAVVAAEPVKPAVVPTTAPTLPKKTAAPAAPAARPGQPAKRPPRKIQL